MHIISLYKGEIIMVRQTDQLKCPEQSWVISLNPSVFVQHDPVWLVLLLYTDVWWGLSESQIDIHVCSFQHLVKKQTVHGVTMQPATTLLHETIETSIWNCQWFRWQIWHYTLHTCHIPNADRATFPEEFHRFWKVLHFLKGLIVLIVQ